MKKYLLFLFTLFSIQSFSQIPDELSISSMIGDHMVLQQLSDVAIWGWNSPDTNVTINPSWAESKTISTNADGKWEVTISTPESGEVHSLEIADGRTSLTISNILMGEVWVCSGQSNMEMPLSGWLPNQPVVGSEEEIANANYPNIRFFKVTHAVGITEKEDVGGSWVECSPTTASNFSAVGYIFGKELHTNLDVPIGLIQTAWGATTAEAWTSVDYLIDVPGFDSIEQDLDTLEVLWGDYLDWFTNLSQISIADVGDKPSYAGIDLNDSELSSAEYDDSEWNTTEVPVNWIDTEFSEFDGAIWYRTEYELPEGTDVNGLELHLGAIDDMDATYINGTLVGESVGWNDWNAFREYAIPDGLLSTTESNSIAIRVIDNYGGGGFSATDKPTIYSSDDVILDLSGTWKYLPVAMITDGSLYAFGEGEYSYDSKPELPFLLDQNMPTSLYNGMVAPIIPYGIKGVTWYQGESNTDYPMQYHTLFPALINSWRDKWEMEDLPFYWAQIAPMQNYDNTPGKNTAELREAQMFAMSLPNTGMAVLLDIGDQWGIHPKNKIDVGKRLSFWALAKDYGMEDLPYSGPVFKSCEFKDGAAYLSFDEIHSGLELRGAANFKIAGSDGRFRTGRPEIENDKIVVSSTNVDDPTQLSYGWTNWVVPSLYNIDSLPSSSFRTYKAFIHSNEYTIRYDSSTIYAFGSDGITVSDFLDEIKISDSSSIKIIDAEGLEQEGSTVVSEDLFVHVDRSYFGIKDEKTYAIDLTIDVSINAIANDQLHELSIYPNPATDLLNIINADVGSTLKISTINGQMVLSQLIVSTHEAISLKHLANGYYILNFDNRENAISFIKD